MDKNALVRRLMTTFVVELDDHVQKLERGLLMLEKDPRESSRVDVFSTLFRSSHSLKGAARVVKVDLIETAGHLLEEIFASARDGRLTLDQDFFALLLSIVDAIRDAGQRLRAERDLIGAPLETATERLSALIQRKGITSEPSFDAMEYSPPDFVAALERTAEEEWSAVVRVPAEKLDNLLTQSGEMLTMRYRIEARESEAATLQEALATWRKEWRLIETGIRTLLNHRRDATQAQEVRNSGAAGDQKLKAAVDRSADALRTFDRNLQRLRVGLRADKRAIEQTASFLDAAVRRARMLPFAQACEGLDRMARDLTRQSSKNVEIFIQGNEIELDRSVLEGLKDPLLHLVRNAVDHGVEPIAARLKSGKSPVGRVVVTAALRGSHVEIAVSDDGVGIDLVAIREQLGKRGLLIPSDERELADCIFLPGMSTSVSVTRVSGRGVGLDVVKSKLASMHGRVDLSFESGRGTRFTLTVPLTLTSVRAVLFGANGQTYAVDAASVRKVLRIGADDIRSIEGREVLFIEGQPMPIVSLLELLGGSSHSALTGAGKVPVVLLSAGNRQAAFVVDVLLGEREIMIRTLGARLRSIRGVGGATILVDGKIALILDPAELVMQAFNPLRSSRLAEEIAVLPHTAKKHLLVVDDSVTIRTLEKSILEAAGYEVTVAADGVEAWQLLLENGADLVVSDIEMPRMDGFSLTETIRGSKRFRDVPVILVTAMESDEDKARGLVAGADAYQLKSAFDQENLLATIRQML